MQEQAEGLKAEISQLQELIMKSNEDPPEDELNSSPSQKDLMDYSKKLETALVESDQALKVQKALSSHRRKPSGTSLMGQTMN